jgi:2-dehydro-3-deoxy-D-arabinonate dehydratase
MVQSYRFARSEVGIIVESGSEIFLLDQPEWAGNEGFQRFFQRTRRELFDSLADATQTKAYSKIESVINAIDPGETPILGAGVTFLNSLRERRLETFRAGDLVSAVDDGRPTPYDVVYDPVNPPEVFFKATSKGHLAEPSELWIRPDGAPNGEFGSSVPEPERVLLVNQFGEIVAETIGSDTTARQLESLSPLYLPAAKTYPGCTTLCPWFTVFNPDMPREAVTISMEIIRDGVSMYRDEYSSDQMKRTPESLVRHARTLADNASGSYPNGFALFTGTGIIPGVEFSLQSGDLVIIDSPQLGRIEAKTRVVTFNF